VNSTQKVSWVAGALLIGCMATSIPLLRQMDAMRSGSSLEEVLYIPSGKVLKRMSLGYEGLLADVYWTRAVQYFGDRHRTGAKEYALLGPLLEITTSLDPHLLVAYDYGCTFLSPPPPNGAGQPARAIKLTKYGIQHNPNEWKLYYQLGFINYMDLHDYAAAAQAFNEGSKVPNAHPFLKVLAAQMAEHAGERQTAFMLWSAAYQTATESSIKANAAAHIRALQVDEDVSTLERMVTAYRQKIGRLPISFDELHATGLLRSTPVDPLGHPYKLMADGRIEVATPDDLPFITKGIPPGYKPADVPKFLPTD
jgi:hypothetical protein